MEGAQPDTMILLGTESIMFGDTDASGIGHYLAQLRLFERAEYFFMKAIGVHPPERDLGVHYPRVHLEVDYLSPVHYGDEVELSAGVERIGTSSYTLAIAIRNVTTQAAAMRGHLTVVTVSRETGRPIPIPDPLRTALNRYRNTDGTP